MNDLTKTVNPSDIESAIQSLNTYVNDASIQPLILVLEELIKAPEDASLLVKLADTLDTVVMQGAVLTYAPYVAVLVSSGLLEDE